MASWESPHRAGWAALLPFAMALCWVQTLLRALGVSYSLESCPLGQCYGWLLPSGHWYRVARAGRRGGMVAQCRLLNGYHIGIRHKVLQILTMSLREVLLAVLLTLIVPLRNDYCDLMGQCVDWASEAWVCVLLEVPLSSGQSQSLGPRVAPHPMGHPVTSTASRTPSPVRI